MRAIFIVSVIGICNDLRLMYNIYNSSNDINIIIVIIINIKNQHRQAQNYLHDYLQSQRYIQVVFTAIIVIVIIDIISVCSNVQYHHKH